MAFKGLGQIGLVGILALAAWVGVVDAKPITYQGQLLVDGVPADGVYDLEFRVYGGATGPLLLGPMVAVNDLQIDGGALNVQLDFGEAFSSRDAYLEISIRLGATQDPFDILLPRQFMTSAPKALHALKADTLSGPTWNRGETPVGSRIQWFGYGDDRVLINRSEPISNLEFLGVHIQYEPIGGMVISNTDPTASTIVAHAPGGVIGAMQQFDGAAQEWALVVGGNEVFVADSGGVRSGPVVADSYAYTNPVTQAVTVSGDVFHSALGTPFNASFFGGGAYLSTPGDNAPMVAPISLPHGATITKLTARLEDNVASNISVSLTANYPDGSLVTLVSVSTDGIAPMAGIQELQSTDVDAMESVIDTFLNGYYLRVFSLSWPGDSSLRIWSVTVEYTVAAPN